MKNIFLISFIFTLIFCKSQQVYPLHTDDKMDLPSGSYFKDLNGELNPYIGLWKGDWNGKTVYLQLKKIKYLSGNVTDPHYIYWDMIVGERKIINADGSISIDRITNFDDLKSEFRGIYKKFDASQSPQIKFYPKNMCGKGANLDVVFLDAGKTQMSLHFSYIPNAISSSCPYYNSVMQGGEFPMNFPVDIVLTKQ